MTDEQHSTFIRAFPAAIERVGPRKLTGRLVPYDEAADVVDLIDGKPDFYREGFRAGAFGLQVNYPGAAKKISLIHTHEGGLGYLGPFIALRDMPDGLYGEATIMPTKADDVSALLDSGINELSVEFRLPKPDSTEVDNEGIRWRTRAHLDQVALEPKGAYSSARVLAYRAELDEQQKAELEAQEAETARLAEEEAARKRAEEILEAEEARKRSWVELSGRLDLEKEKQRQLVEHYGVTKPGGYGRL